MFENFKDNYNIKQNKKFQKNYNNTYNNELNKIYSNFITSLIKTFDQNAKESQTVFRNFDIKVPMANIKGKRFIQTAADKNNNFKMVFIDYVWNDFVKRADIDSISKAIISSVKNIISSDKYNNVFALWKQVNNLLSDPLKYMVQNKNEEIKVRNILVSRIIKTINDFINNNTDRLFNKFSEIHSKEQNMIQKNATSIKANIRKHLTSMFKNSMMGMSTESFIGIKTAVNYIYTTSILNTKENISQNDILTKYPLLFKIYKNLDKLKNNPDSYKMLFNVIYENQPDVLNVINNQINNIEKQFESFNNPYYMYYKKYISFLKAYFTYQHNVLKICKNYVNNKIDRETLNKLLNKIKVNFETEKFTLQDFYTKVLKMNTINPTIVNSLAHILETFFVHQPVIPEFLAYEYKHLIDFFEPVLPSESKLFMKQDPLSNFLDKVLGEDKPTKQDSDNEIKERGKIIDALLDLVKDNNIPINDKEIEEEMKKYGLDTSDPEKIIEFKKELLSKNIIPTLEQTNYQIFSMIQDIKSLISSTIYANYVTLTDLNKFKNLNDFYEIDIERRFLNLNYKYPLVDINEIIEKETTNEKKTSTLYLDKFITLSCYLNYISKLILKELNKQKPEVSKDLGYNAEMNLNY
ncbi:hypothetical protein DEFDS_P081 (plasmid) [Deferribacter desulfuricans SSM1]|uniref:Uncharacterized protein n=1 Tax=Deferribacter desulfuricans (strain DSM 14783 / JCM 11476 / NBRC 101012 / SSM1) TaxID=639282 RepID=D3PER3_DEFDS|nr:hypothetical protein [Deferribacter desulfuricans]BAI81705.1 hypothetical protein DEFDS_P081 [Deferribacter desulfuricans SSM1]